MVEVGRKLAGAPGLTIHLIINLDRESFAEVRMGTEATSSRGTFVLNSKKIQEWRQPI